MSSDSEDDMPLGARVVKKEVISPPAAKDDKGKGQASKSASAAKTKVKVKKEAGDDKVGKKSGKGAADSNGSAKATGGKGKAQVSKAEKKPKRWPDAPWQKRETPPEGDPLRKFYESLREQRPESRMAEDWLLSSNLLPLEMCKELHEKKEREKAAAKSPSKAANGARSGRKAPAESGTGSKARKGAAAAQNDGPAGTGKRKQRVSWPSNGDSSDEEDEDDAPLAKRAKKAQTGKKAAPASQSAEKKPAPPRSRKKDVAFADGGLDSSDSEDDMPLVARAKAIAK